MPRATPRVSQILETSLYVDDLDRSRRFYERLFGFTAFMQDERMCAMEVPGEQVLLLFRHGMTDAPASVPGGFIPPHHGRGALHLAFAIPYGELDAWQARRALQVRRFAQRHHLVARAGEMRGEMPILAREVLMDEEKAHHSGSRIARRR